MDYKEKYFNLYQFFGGYLNQSWKEIYVWEGREPSFQPIVRGYKVEFPERDVKATIIELKEIMIIGNGSDDEGWMNILTWGLSLGYYPPGDGQTYEEWLKVVLSILEEPIEETRKHFVPKGI